MFDRFRTVIPPEWIDYNGHMNDAAYAQALTLANEAFLDHLDLSDGYRKRTGCTMYTVDLHLAYKAEVQGLDSLSARTAVALLAPKKLQLATDLVRADGTVAASAEVLYLHYDQRRQQVVPFAPEQTARLALWLEQAPAGA